MFSHTFFSFKLCICQDPRTARAYTAQNTKICALLVCPAQPTYPIPARCGTDTAGQGAFEPPPEDGARTKLFDREFQFRVSHTEAETEKTPTESPPKRMIIHSRIHLYIYIIQMYCIHSIYACMHTEMSRLGVSVLLRWGTTGACMDAQQFAVFFFSLLRYGSHSPQTQAQSSKPRCLVDAVCTGLAQVAFVCPIECAM